MVAELARTEMAELERHNTEIKCTELVEHGRFSTISDAVEIALEDLVHNIEGIPYAMPETRRETMQVADAFRAKRRRAIGKRWRMPEFLLT
jgi:Arc/MetJ-type ribon-helix-helix transcriptional regulator